jgi:hypothetical protein
MSMRAVTFGAVELMAITGLAQIQRSPAQTPSSIPGGAKFSDGRNRDQLVAIVKISKDCDGSVTSRILTHLPLPAFVWCMIEGTAGRRIRPA